MTPAMLKVLNQIKMSLKRDLDVLQNLVDQKAEEYIKISSMLYHMEGDIEAMQGENTEKLVINCDPPDVDDEGRLL